MESVDIPVKMKVADVKIAGVGCIFADIRMSSTVGGFSVLTNQFHELLIILLAALGPHS